MLAIICIDELSDDVTAFDERDSETFLLSIRSLEAIRRRRTSEVTISESMFNFNSLYFFVFSFLKMKGTLCEDY